MVTHRTVAGRGRGDPVLARWRGWIVLAVVIGATNAGDSSAIAETTPPASQPASAPASTPADSAPERVVPDSATARLTSSVWRPVDPPLDLHWELLRLPERVFRLALAPLYPLVDTVERYRLDQRLYDLMTNDAGTILVFPLFFVLGSDGLGGGLSFRHSDLFGNDEKLRLSAAVFTNVDYALQASYLQTVAFLNGRTVRLDVRYEEDDNVRYYGIGGDTQPGDERGMRRETVDARVQVDVLAPEFVDLRSQASLRYRHELLGTGSRSGVPGLGEAPGDERLLPPGFDQRIDYLEGRLAFTIDRRQPPGRTTAGWIAQADFAILHDLNADIELSAVRLALSGSLYTLVLPRYRVLVLSAGGAAALPWGGEEEVPLQGYVKLGRTSHLRGYARDRFLDRYAWWASAEYRYPILDYPINEHMGDDLTISFTVFADIGRAGDSLGELFGKGPRWSSGFGLHFATASYSILLFQLGFSPEGVEIMFTIGNLPI